MPEVEKAEMEPGEFPDMAGSPPSAGGMDTRKIKLVFRVADMCGCAAVIDVHQVVVEFPDDEEAGVAPELRRHRRAEMIEAAFVTAARFSIAKLGLDRD